jgi:hypothetical protein
MVFCLGAKLGLSLMEEGMYIVVFQSEALWKIFGPKKYKVTWKRPGIGNLNFT